MNTTSPYEGADVLAELDHWDDKTRRVVSDRLHHVPAIRFFTPDEAKLLEAAAARILPQQDRAVDQRVPIAPFLDQMLADGDTDGFRQPEMPWEQEAWRQGLAGVDETSLALHGRPFVGLIADQQDDVLRCLQGGEPPGPTWRQMPAASFFGTLVTQVAAVYYAHPHAWNEIGWPGPASPRGYVRTGLGRRDPWEPQERRAASSVPVVHRHEEQQGHAPGSQGGTH